MTEKSRIKYFPLNARHRSFYIPFSSFLSLFFQNMSPFLWPPATRAAAMEGESQTISLRSVPSAETEAFCELSSSWSHGTRNLAKVCCEPFANKHIQRRHVYANARCRSYPAKSKSQNVSQLHFQGRGFRLTGTPVSITPVSRCTLLRYIQIYQ